MKDYALTALPKDLTSAREEGKHISFLAIAHLKGVVLCEQYEGKISGDMFSDFMKTHLQETFN